MSNKIDGETLTSNKARHLHLVDNVAQATNASNNAPIEKNEKNIIKVLPLVSSSCLEGKNSVNKVSATGALPTPRPTTRRAVTIVLKFKAKVDASPPNTVQTRLIITAGFLPNESEKMPVAFDPLPKETSRLSEGRVDVGIKK